LADRPDEVAQLEPRQRRAGHDVGVTATERRNVGGGPATEPLTVQFISLIFSRLLHTTFVNRYQRHSLKEVI